MKRICGGTPGRPCGKALDPPEKEPFEDPAITHGICPECFKDLARDFETKYPDLARAMEETIGG